MSKSVLIRNSRVAKIWSVTGRIIRVSEREEVLTPDPKVEWFVHVVLARGNPAPRDEVFLFAGPKTFYDYRANLRALVDANQHAWRVDPDGTIRRLLDGQGTTEQLRHALDLETRAYEARLAEWRMKLRESSYETKPERPTSSVVLEVSKHVVGSLQYMIWVPQGGTLTVRQRVEGLSCDLDIFMIERLELEDLTLPEEGEA